MIHCLSCKRYPTDVKVIPYGSDFPSDEFMVSLISKDLPNSMSISSADVVELPSGCKFAVGSKLHVVNGNDGSEVYVWNSEEFVLVESNVEPKEPDGDVTPEGEILDSWGTIIANIDNGTYSTKYSVGNYKPLDLGSEGIVNMQIVAFDKDKATSGGTAPITFVAKELLNTTRRLSNISKTSTYSWTNSTLKTYLNTDVYALLPESVQSHLVGVNKYFAEGSVDTNLKLWIPSLDEVSFGEYTIGNIVYDDVYTDLTSRIKHKASDAINRSWWTRTRNASNNTKANYIGYNGSNIYSTYPLVDDGICLGFCLGLEPA